MHVCGITVLSCSLGKCVNLYDTSCSACCIYLGLIFKVGFLKFLSILTNILVCVIRQSDQNCWCGIFIARCCFSSCCTLCNDVIRGRCGGLFQASGGSANGIFVASVLLSIQAICPKRERCLCWMVDLKSHNLTLTEALDMAENCSFSGCWQRLALRTVVQPNSDDDEMLFAL